MAQLIGGDVDDMRTDSGKIYRVGIDWLTLYNFELTYKNTNFISEKITDEFYQESFKKEEPSYSIEFTKRLYEEGKETNFQSLRINPNKILYGHNIHNARSEELSQAIDILIKKLDEEGIILDLKNAKIKDIEINLNIPKPFRELKETFELLFSDVPGAKKIGRLTPNKSYKHMFEDETIYGSYNYSLVKVYDKTEESKLDIDITRLEWRFLKRTYANIMKAQEVDNSLNQLLLDFTVIDKLFVEKTKSKLFIKGMNYLEKVLKKNLEIEYIRFKENNKLGVSLGKKEKRGVFKHLEETCWIFDYSFLIELVSKYDKPHKSREIKNIKSKFSNHNNLEKINYLMEIIFNH